MLAIESAGMGVWEYDLACGKVYCSERVMEIFGLEQDFVPLDALVEQVVPEHRKMVRERILDAITLKSENYEVDFSLVNVKDGSLRSVISKGKLFQDINGSPVKLVGTCLDITRERIVSEQLRLSFEKYRHLFESSPVALCEENLNFFREVAFQLDQSGVKDFHTYFREHPEEYLTLVRNIQVNAVNSAILQLVEADSKEEVINGLEKIFVGPTQNDIIDQLVFILRGGGIMNSKPPCGP